MTKNEITRPDAATPAEGEASPRARSTRQKALELNLDPLFYGSIVEIGAGQEVARHFFQAGGASGTVAKTMSAYDMQVSDAIYGADASGRYVTRSRLEAMLEREFGLVIERLKGSRPAESTFFAFADTVAAKAYKKDRDCHGWMGITFQHAPGAEPSRILLHVHMLDSTNRGQQEALGTLGVNLMDAVYRHRHEADALVDALMDNLRWGRLEIDLIDFTGPCFAAVDNRVLNLRLVQAALGPVVMFGPDGQAALPADLLWNKDVLILRGSFRPFTTVHRDMLDEGLPAFAAGLGVDPGAVTCFCEVNIAQYFSEGRDEVSDLLDRVEMITELGYHVMVSSHYRYFRLSQYFTNHAQRKVGFLLSVDNIRTLFDAQFYEGMEGGLLQGMASLFAAETQLLVYPIITAEGEVLTAETFAVPERQRFLYQHLLDNRRILPLAVPPDRLVPLMEETLAARIARGDPHWRETVPKLVRDRIESRLGADGQERD